jgi:hypothetical protein
VKIICQLETIQHVDATADDMNTNCMRISADLQKLPYNRYPVEVGSILLQYIMKHLQSCHKIEQKDS